jgi:excisionase family DNA binding protein
LKEEGMMVVSDPDAKWLSIAEVARQLGLSEAQVRARIRDGQLHAERFYGRVVVADESVKRYAAGERA